MRRAASKTIAWLLVALWAAAIFVVSARPGNTIPGGFSIEGHVFEYFVLGALVMWALGDGTMSRPTLVMTIVLCSLYGITDEFHQHFVPMRTPDVVDWVLDTLGAAVGAFAASLLMARAAHRRVPTEGPDTD